MDRKLSDSITEYDVTAAKSKIPSLTHVNNISDANTRVSLMVERSSNMF